MGRIHSIETMGAADGPGLRTVVFLQGCPLRCSFCHNPDTWEFAGGTEQTAEDVMKKVLRMKPYYKDTGGLTLSGGEPFAQSAFALELLRLAKNAGISTVVDTSGTVLNDTVKEALSYTDLVLLDIKHTRPDEFRRLTGVEMDRLHAFLAHCRQTGQPLWIRQVIVPGITDDEENVRAIKTLTKGLNVQKYQLLPYHTLGVQKWEKLGLPYPLEGVAPPSAEVMKRLQNML